MCLAETPKDPLARRVFVTTSTLASGKRKHILEDSLVDCGCTGVYTVINEALIPQICESLEIEPLPLSTPKLLRGYDGRLSKKPITHFILPALIVNGHRESICPMLIAPLQHDMILGKPWMNKHGVVLDMLRDKLLFVPGRCKHNGNVVSDDKDLQFVTPPPVPKAILSRNLPLPIDPALLPKAPKKPSPAPLLSPPPSPSRSASPRSFSSGDSSSSSRPRKRGTPAPRYPKDELDIYEIGAASFHNYARKSECRLFTMTIAEKDVSAHKYPVPTTKVKRNIRCLCNSGIKYKHCCGSNQVAINVTEDLDQSQIKQLVPDEYQDYLDVFDRDKADELPPHRSYDYKLEFIDDTDKSKLPRSRIYPMSGHKLEQVKKYLDEYLKKGFIIPSKVPFASPILFAEKPNGGLRFCVDYRKLNAITKRNRYPIPLIDEVLARIQGCKYLTRLDIIAAFNKLRMHPDSKDYIIFITSLGVYKYRVLPFGLTNGPASYQQYMNDILFEYLNVFCQVYLDDILIYSKTKKEYVQHVRMVLQKLRDAGLQADILKCEFHVQETKFLRLMVSIDGLRINPVKI